MGFVALMSVCGLLPASLSLSPWVHEKIIEHRSKSDSVKGLTGEEENQEGRTVRSPRPTAAKYTQDKRSQLFRHGFLFSLVCRSQTKDLELKELHSTEKNISLDFLFIVSET